MGRAGTGIEDSAIQDETDESLLLCPDCGYDLRRRASDRCPECGLSLGFIDSAVSAIPWVHRRERGRVRSYLATLGFVGLANRRFCREMFRPVSYADAQRFRWVTVALLYVAMLGTAAMIAALVPFDHLSTRPRVLLPGFDDPQYPPRTLMQYALNDLGPLLTIAGALALASGLLLTMIAATGLPSYLFHPRSISVELQNRAIAMSYYACAPLATFMLTGIPVMALIIAAWFWLEPPADLLRGTINLAGACAIGIFDVAAFCYWLALVVLARRTLLSSAAALRVAVLTPILWLVGTALSFAVPSTVLFFVWLIIDSVP